MCLLIKHDGKGDSPAVLAEKKVYFLIFWLLKLRKCWWSAGISQLTVAEYTDPDYSSTNPGLFEGKHPVKNLGLHQFVSRSKKPLKSNAGKALPCLDGNTNVSKLLVTRAGQSVALWAQNRAVGGCGGPKNGPSHPHVPLRPNPGC